MFILNPYTKVGLPLVFEIDTTKTGVTDSNSFRIPFAPSPFVYNYKVDWGDGNVTSGHTSAVDHTYSSGGVKTIKIYGVYPKFYFNGTGDRLKLLRVLDWGDLVYSPNQSNAFRLCENLTEIAFDLNGWYNSVENGAAMFHGCKLSSLPSNMTLSSLTNGSSMFRENLLSSLPSNMTLSALINGNTMFYGNPITTLSSNMTLSSLTNGNSMFFLNSISSIPSTMTLNSLTTADSMFRGNAFTDLPSAIKLSALTNGANMFLAVTMNTARYSQLLVDMQTLNPNNSVTFHGGASKYNTTGQSARNILTASPRNWTITDGGLV